MEPTVTRMLEDSSNYYQEIDLSIFSKVVKIIHPECTDFQSETVVCVEERITTKWKYISYNDYDDIIQGFSVSYYVLALYRDFTIELLAKLFKEDFNYTDEMTKILLLNKYLTDDLKLWLRLQ